MSRLLVSFSTRPGHGSEGGVGWAFLKAGLEVCAAGNETLHLIYDSRDEADVRRHAARLPGAELLRLYPLNVPDALRRRYGDARTRQTYLGWRMKAKHAIAELCRKQEIAVVHQTTFATAVLPSAIPTGVPAKTIWGPLSVPWAPSHPEGARPSLTSRAGAKLGRELGRRNVSGLDLVIATNDLTAELFSSRAKAVVTEPNIVVDLDRLPSVERDSELLTMAGLLIDLKRPWLALQALQDTRLRSLRLQVIGDGPLRKSLESFANQEGLRGRVAFKGRLPHREVTTAMAKSRALVHPSVREGASWVVGEAAAVGIPSIVFEGVGAATTVKLSNNGGAVCAATGNLATNLADGIIEVLSRPEPVPSERWSAKRLPGLLQKWWLDK